MSEPLQFFVPGTAAPGGSKTGFYNGKLNRVLMSPACKRTKPWMSLVAGTVRSEYRGEPLTGPLCVVFTFHLLRPKGHYGSGKNEGIVKKQYEHSFPIGKPDAIKLARSTEDALKGILYNDDSQNVSITSNKIYCTKDPGVYITIYQI
jgi:Holliday junction resolvase RusA-like endonuclease